MVQLPAAVAVLAWFGYKLTLAALAANLATMLFFPGVLFFGLTAHN